MPNGLKQLAENLLELKEAFSEEELLAGSLHPRAEHVILLLRNLAALTPSKEKEDKEP